MALPDAIILTTERLTLRPLRAADSAVFYDLYRDTDALRFWSCAPHEGKAQTDAYIRDAVEAPGIRIWAITQTGGADEALGTVALVDGERNDEAEIGFILRREVWGRGYAREAAAAMIGHAFATSATRRIHAEVDPDNAASIATLEQLGFFFERRIPDRSVTNLGVRDSLIYGLLNPDLHH